MIKAITVLAVYFEPNSRVIKRVRYSKRAIFKNERMKQLKADNVPDGWLEEAQKHSNPQLLVGEIDYRLQGGHGIAGLRMRCNHLPKKSGLIIKLPKYRTTKAAWHALIDGFPGRGDH